MPLVLIVVLVVLALGAIPAWPYSRDWGYYPRRALTVAFPILLAPRAHRAAVTRWPRGFRGVGR